MPEHVPVMAQETLTYLDPRPGQTLVDATIGSGGHAAALLERLLPEGRVIGIDRDAEAVQRCRARFAGQPVILVNDNFRRLEVILDDLGIADVDGVLLDFGVSSEQLASAERGFSFQEEGPLDMRMDRRTRTTAGDLVNDLPEERLAALLWELGGERWARRLARHIATSRQRSPITTTTALAEIVTAAIPARARPKRIHPATRTFLALRIGVNDELAALPEAIDAAVNRTRSHGRIVALSYHSLEDGVTKEEFRQLARSCRCPPLSPQCTCEGRPRVRILTKKPIRPPPEEVKRNPRARSACLRAAEKL